MKSVVRWCWSAAKTTARAIDRFVFAELFLARQANSQIEERLAQLEEASTDCWSADPRASLPTENLHEADSRELGYRSELVAKTHQLVNAAGLVVTLVAAGTVITISIADGGSDYRLPVIGLLAVAMCYFLLSWRMILGATAPAKVFQFSIEDAAEGDDEATATLRAIDSNRQVTRLILNRSSVARSSVWRALVWASVALAVAVTVAYVGPNAQSAEGGDQEAVETCSDAEPAPGSSDRRGD